MPEIFVDADACPVKDEVLRVAERYDLVVHLVSNAYLRFAMGHPLVRPVVVPEGPDKADDWIAERAGPADIVITSDIPLAARCIANQARVLAPNGKPFTEASIGNVLATRNLMTHLREIGEITSGPGSFGKNDRSRFLSALDTMVQAAKREG
ncbi:YaiI/YqxD family protein [Telmatospirillum sp. J64-1]|uniref:YaiI/YqxD family protein n=1 Tax=Telmatospirillum sp. J64-1 TaxID=2502183 RepID=UPI00115F531D|nr:YaiI/YqxD family protein [Telmatospirillum sp. J64-1]